jgi:hypothetical protein
MPKYYAVPTIDPRVFDKAEGERVPFNKLHTGNMFMTDSSADQICLRGQVNKETRLVTIVQLGRMSCWTCNTRHEDDTQVVTQIRVKPMPDKEGQA